MLRHLIVIAMLGLTTIASAQLPGPLKNLDKGGEKDRNDAVEGMIWEYKATPEKTNAKDEKVEPLEGKFRLEDTAIFDVSPTFKLPSKEEVKKVVDKVVAGKGANVKLPAGPQQKRLGEFRKISGGKYRLDFNDADSLHGLMLIWKKKNTDDVWMGTYDERVDNKTVRKWNVELKPIED